MTPFYDSSGVTIYHGDVLEALRALPAGIVQTVVTSPPYWGLRDYGVPGQIGLEKTPEEFVAKLMDVFREVRRVLRDDGTLWLNLGDSYAAAAPGARDGARWPKQERNGHGHRGADKRRAGLKPKDLVGIPWRVAFALQADGWYLRSDIIWSKPNPMPESVTDRPTKAHEYIFLLSKAERYFYDADATREPQASLGERHEGKSGYRSGHPSKGGITQCALHPLGRNIRTVWDIATQPFTDAHFAVFPTEIPRLCIEAGTSAWGACAVCGAPWRRIVEKTKHVFAGDGKHVPGADQVRDGAAEKGFAQPSKWRTEVKTVGWRRGCDCPTRETRPCLVLDPFHGAGTTAMVAKNLGRRYVGAEINEAYIRMSTKRLTQEVLPLAG